MSFDDLAPGSSHVLIPQGYGGLQWYYFGVLDGSLRLETQGYRSGMVSASNVAFNLLGEPASISRNSTFTLDSAYLTAAFVEGMQIQVRGFVGLTPIYDNTYVVGTAAPTLIHFNYVGVDRVTFVPTPASQFAMDDLVVTFLEPCSTIVAWGNNDVGQTNVPPNLTNAIAVAAGSGHTLALRADGTVAAWGYNWDGQCSVPADLTNAVAVAAGGSFSVALRADGTVVAWGNNTLSQCSVPGDLNQVVAVAAGSYHSLALKSDGTVVAWGYNWNGECSVPPGLGNVVAVAAGDQYGLALQADGRVIGWGFNYWGQTRIPADLTNAVAIAAGRGHSLALRYDGRVVAWGRGDSGQTTVPADLTNAVAIAAGSYHSLAIREDGSVIGCGHNDYGEIRVPPTITNAVAVAEGGAHSVALVGDGRPVILSVGPLTRTVYGSVEFGVRATGQRPLHYQWWHDGSPVDQATTSVLALTDVRGTSSGSYWVTVSNALGAITSRTMHLSVIEQPPFVTIQPLDVTTYPGGSARFEVQASGSTPLRYQWLRNQLPIPEATNAVLLLTGVDHSQADGYSVIVSNSFGSTTSTTAILSVVNVVAWSLHDSGSYRVRRSNVPADLTDVVAVSAGDGSNLALRRDGTVCGWNGSAYLTNVPSGLSDVMLVAAGGSCHLALRRDGTVVSWGNPAYTNLPPGLSDVVALANGGRLSVALKSDGTVVAWEKGGWALRPWVTNIPPDLRNVVAVAANSSSWFALRGDGRVVTRADTNTPPSDSLVRALPGLSNVVAIAAMTNTVLALRNDGTVVVPGGQPLDPALTNVVDLSAQMESVLALRRDETVMARAPFPSYRLSATNVPPGLSNVTCISAGSWFRDPSYLALIGEGPPMILSQPMSLTAFSGQPALLRATAAGAMPLLYQWQRNGTNIAGATNAWLFLDRTQFDDAGTYTVVVSNALGVASSTEAMLAVAASPPFITHHPLSETVGYGSPVSLQVEVEGSAPQLVQWQFNGADLAVTAEPSLSWTNAGSADTGYYRAIVWNDYGFDVSEEALVTAVPVVACGSGWWGTTNLFPSLTNAVALACGSSHNLALKADGTVVAWGGFSPAPTNGPADLTDAVAIAAGESFSLALRADGSVVSWGDSAYGTNVPPGLTDVAAVACGAYHSLALNRDGIVVAWGYNDSEQTNVPPDLTNAVAIAGGWSFSLALKADGTVVQWGDLPDGIELPPNLSEVMAIACGYAHSLALRRDGTVVAWGSNSSGQTNVPPDLTNAVAVAAGRYCSLALKADGTVVGWGESVAARIPPYLANAVAIAASGSHALALVAEPGQTPQPPELVDAAFSDGAFHLSAQTKRGKSYRFEFSDSLSEGVWTMLPPVPGDGTVKALTDPGPFSSQRFYRVRQW